MGRARGECVGVGVAVAGEARLTLLQLVEAAPARGAAQTP